MQRTTSKVTINCFINKLLLPSKRNGIKIHKGPEMVHVKYFKPEAH